MENTRMEKDKVILGEVELSNIVRALVRAYRFKNQNKEPKVVVIPDIKEVDGVKVEFQGQKQPTGQGNSTASK